MIPNLLRRCRALALAFSLSTAFAAGPPVYLFYYFDGAQNNGLWLSHSPDGRAFTTLQNKPLYRPYVGQWETFRDPSVFVGPDSILRLVWTAGTTGFGYSSSKDWVRFDSARYIEPSRAALGHAFKNVWAPEIHFDADSGLYRIVFASTPDTATDLDQYGYSHRSFEVTTRDWKTFSPVRPFGGLRFDHIDGIVTKFKNQYHFFLKDERQGKKSLRKAVGPSFSGPFSDTTAFLTPTDTEGPALLWVKDTLRLYFDRWNGGGIRGFIQSTDLKTWSAEQTVTNTQKTLRHGTPLLTDSSRFARMKQALASPTPLRRKEAGRMEGGKAGEAGGTGRKKAPFKSLKGASRGVGNSAGPRPEVSEGEGRAKRSYDGRL